MHVKLKEPPSGEMVPVMSVHSATGHDSSPIGLNIMKLQQVGHNLDILLFF